MPEPRVGSFTHEGFRLVYDEYGSGSRHLVLLPGLLLPRLMHRPLAEELAARGNHVYTLDLLGHGDSDQPRDMWRYSMPIFGAQVVALLDHLGLDEAVVGGTSLGANVTLEVAAAAPDRLRGIVVEMPVLDNALLGCALAFTPLLVSLTFGAPVTRLVSQLARLVPRGASHLTRHRPRVDQPRPCSVRGGAAGAVLRPRRAAALRARPDRDEGARARPPARPDPPVLGRRHAGSRAAQRTHARGQLDARAAARAGAADERDRRLSWTSAGGPRPPRTGGWRSACPAARSRRKH